MNRDRRSKRHSNSSNWKNSGQRKNEGRGGNSRSSFRSPHAVTAEQIRADEAAIAAFKAENQPVCECCGRVIMDIANAIENRSTGNPIHFDCALDILAKQETLGTGDKLSYIGQGRFGIIYRENPHDMKHFTIKKIIEWESKEKKPVWRGQMAELYSRIK